MIVIGYIPKIIKRRVYEYRDMALENRYNYYVNLFCECSIRPCIFFKKENPTGHTAHGIPHNVAINSVFTLNYFL